MCYFSMGYFPMWYFSQDYIMRLRPVLPLARVYLVNTFGGCISEIIGIKPGEPEEGYQER
jgi:hypothetical protein